MRNAITLGAGFTVGVLLVVFLAKHLALWPF
jgi:hypothetical protein